MERFKKYYDQTGQSRDHEVIDRSHNIPLIGWQDISKTLTTMLKSKMFSGGEAQNQPRLRTK